MKNVAHRAALDHLAGIHDGHAVAKLGDDAEMVRDEEHRAAGVALQLLQEVDHLHFKRRVESGGGLVGDQEVGLGEERHGDADALPHAAGELVRVLRQPPLGVGDAHFLQKLDGAPALGARARPGAVLDFGHLRADGHHRIERRHRILKNGGDAVAEKPRERFSAVRRRRSMSLKRTLPPTISALSARRPSTALISVDLPQPDSPTMPTISPAGTARLTSRSACIRPAAVRKSTERFWMSRTGFGFHEPPHTEALAATAGASKHRMQGAFWSPRGSRLATLAPHHEGVWHNRSCSADFPEARVEAVAQRLAEEREAERGDDDRQAAGDRRPRALADEGEAVVQDRAPGGGRRTNAEPEEAHPGFDGDDDGNVHRGENEERADKVRHDVDGEDAPGGRAERARRKHEVGLLQRHRLRAHHAGVARQRREHHDQDDGIEARAGERHQRERKHHGREGAERVEEEEKQRIEPARSVAGDHAEHHAAEEGQAGGEQRHEERDARAVQHAREKVAAELVGAEQMQRVRRKEAVARRKLRRLVGGEHVGEDRAEDDDEHERDAERRRSDRRRAKARSAPPRMRGAAGGVSRLKETIGHAGRARPRPDRRRACRARRRRW